MDDIVRICSIDIGTRNFALCIEELQQSKLKNKQQLTFKQKFINGIHTIQYIQVLEDLYKATKTIYVETYDLVQNNKRKCEFDPHNLLRMNVCLTSLLSLIASCHVIIIEKQMKSNTLAQVMGQHCYSFLLYHFELIKPILFYKSSYKNKVIGFPRGLNWGKRKKWGVEKVKDILKIRKDKKLLDRFMLKGKKDDLSDTILQAISFFYLAFIEHQKF